MTDRGDGTERSRGQAREEVVNLRRRRLGQGLIGGGVLTMALRAGSVRASGCMAPSAVMSAHPSSHHEPQTCSGRSPGAWKTTWEKYSEDDKLIGVANEEGWSYPWPGGYSGSDSFRAIFGRDPVGVGSADATLHDALSAGGKDADGDDIPNVAAYFVATLLNIAAGFVPIGVLDEAGLILMYKQFVDGGEQYVPYGGARPWGAYEMKIYLGTTWGEDGYTSNVAFTMLR